MPSIALDKAYECPECQKDLTLHEDFSTKTWLCAVCSTPVYIRVSDAKDNRYTLERRPAQALLVGDLILLEARLDRDYEVLSSASASQGKWRLALKGYRAITVDGGKHYSVIIGGW